MGMLKSIERKEIVAPVMAILVVTGFRPPVVLGDTFADSSSWATFDPGAHGVGTDPVGYCGGVFDGRYVYFAPSVGSAGNNHGEVLRYDTQCDFQIPGCWEAYDPGANDVGTDPDGYRGAAFDGRYVYFAPYYNGSEYHAEVLRYDTSQDFGSTSSWATFDASAVPDAGFGYHGALYANGYVYFVPGRNDQTDFHGKVLRYDTSCDFSTTTCWDVFDAVAQISARGGVRQWSV
jgi:hypothetical protein